MVVSSADDRMNASLRAEAKSISTQSICFLWGLSIMGLSIRAYARLRGVSHVAVLRAARAGRITLEPDGTVDAAKADSAWERTTEPGRDKPKPQRLKAVADAAVGSVRETLKEQGLPASGNVTFVQARTAHEIAKAHLARLRLQRMKGELVDRARAMALVFRLAREERDGWINWPVRVAALMAAELGVEAHPMQKVLETYVRSHLADLAEVQPEFR
ncbi:MAG: elements of external origin [Alphaproteobacteria bacterium]